MSDSNYAPAHHQTTSKFDDDQQYNNTRGTTSGISDANTGSGITSASATGTSELRTGWNSNYQDDSIQPTSNYGTDSSADYDRRGSASVHQPRTSVNDSAHRGSLASTEGPFQQPTTDNVSNSDTNAFSSVSSQNAPHAGGTVGENTLGALGYGGSQVERPKEEQGVAEKIMNILGA